MAMFAQKTLLRSFLVLATIPALASSIGLASSLKVGDSAPALNLKNHEGENFSLEQRKGKGWTILFFYPKAGTPGCTKQACAFRDAADDIRKQNAEVYGISTDTVEKQAAFHKEQKLSFSLLSDPDAKTADDYRVKVPIVKLAKRWTFIVDPELKIRHINDNVDPLLDAKQMIAVLKTLQGKSDTKTEGKK